MTPKRIAFGQRYGDDSGWQHFLSVDTEAGSVMIETPGSDIHMTADDLWWIVRAALAAREHLGMDKLLPDGPVASVE